ncbi:nucleotide exchange factor GrpE [Gloeobacter kilaueensis]|uniref:Protein GrpE n=1 Tax=Gloeobacter kilaueensis (strain ATCC BAA-2537 / CCAP 1431/1 / ULC 316 / JS1) TaxID=1183438 RepID=U5QCG1_GLOK1|nr:nucleotide exchange factor GrpE [Gloeobacter kilaueensis]AGY56556.1 GrpE protein [Gloeobacter kilaueensis JS1]
MAENESVTENSQPPVTAAAAAPPTGDPAGTAGSDIDQAAQLEQLAATNTQLQEKLGEQEQKYLRLLADFDNFRKRTQREKDELGAFVSARLLQEILPVLDNFDRARTHVQPENEREEKLHNSYQQVYRQFLAILEKQGVQLLEVVGQPFNPALHEAILREESSEVSQETVVAELQKGYSLGERVLRPAMVKVAVPAHPA